MPKLLLKFETAVIREIPIGKKTITIGRKSDNDIVLDNQAVSGHHCKISSSGTTFFVEDLASTNGTRVNGKKIIKAGLRHNDVIEIVKHSLVFMDERAGSQKQDGQSAAASPAATDSSGTDSRPSRNIGKPQAAPHPQIYQERAVPGRNGALPNGEGSPPPKAGKSAPNLMTGSKTAVGILQVTEGVVDKLEYQLTELSTYIGKSDRVAIPIKGTGMFGTAPEIAAMIARRPEGYFIVAIKEGYPTLNGVPITKKVPLKDGDVIVVGATTLRFSSK